MNIVKQEFQEPEKRPKMTERMTSWSGEENMCIFQEWKKIQKKEKNGRNYEDILKPRKKEDDDKVEKNKVNKRGISKRAPMICNQE